MSRIVGLDLEFGDLVAGIAGEHLVLADLLLSGHRAFRSDQHCPYDIVVDLAGRIVRVQVKSARQPSIMTRRNRGRHNPAYIWNVKRAGAAHRRRYAFDTFDVLALVALDIRRVAYVRWVGQQYLQLPMPGTKPMPSGHGTIARQRNFEDQTFERAVSE